MDLLLKPIHDPVLSIQSFCDWFMLIYGRNQHNIVKEIILQLKIN